MKGNMREYYDACKTATYEIIYYLSIE